jgi:BlaI family transcriptional regulator, penicillinase repressor
VAHVWRPAVTRRQVMGPLLRNLVRNAFGGRTADALQHLLGDRAIDAAERKAIRRLLDDHARRERGE